MPTRRSEERSDAGDSTEPTRVPHSNGRHGLPPVTALLVSLPLAKSLPQEIEAEDPNIAVIGRPDRGLQPLATISSRAHAVATHSDGRVPSARDERIASRPRERRRDAPRCELLATARTGVSIVTMHRAPPVARHASSKRTATRQASSPSRTARTTVPAAGRAAGSLKPMLTLVPAATRSRAVPESHHGAPTSSSSSTTMPRPAPRPRSVALPATGQRAPSRRSTRKSCASSSRSGQHSPSWAPPSQSDARKVLGLRSAVAIDMESSVGVFPPRA